MRFLPKGGIWKNTEDEILKACVMKYGLNQWSRISSLLTRKSAKQCKARWYEWLDPSIKKTEWSKEEEEKLLHLAKIMPTQWRTIAPIIGRTAVQCLEHYEKLISVHEGEKTDGDDPKRLRPGEIDPAPETKPARPDPVDMDEDELEMLQEARARLANTKGKKAKRKARERMLKEARRMAAIQKNNELKAAGINSKEKKYRKDNAIDYNAEIPFHVKQPIGFYDTFNEDKHSAENRPILDFKRLTSERFEGNPEKAEALHRRKDLKRQRLQREADLPTAVARTNRLADPQHFVGRRSELLLPAPSISAADLSAIARLFPEHCAGEADAPGDGLPAARTPSTAELRRRDVADSRALRGAENPLLGGESVLLNDPLFARRGIALQHERVSRAVTPNVLLAQALQKTGLTPSATPSRPETPLNCEGLLKAETPLRDGLSINSGGLKRRRKRLKKRLGMLPAPKRRGGLRIVLPEAVEEELRAEKKAQRPDKDDVAKEAEAEGKRLGERRRQMLSSAEKRGLPLPKCSSKPVEFFTIADDFKVPKKLISAELKTILAAASNGNPIFEWAELPLIKQAAALLNAEKAKLQNPPKSGENANFLSADEKVLFHPRRRVFGFEAEIPAAERREALRQEAALLRGHAAALGERAAKARGKTALRLGGLRRRAEKAVCAVDRARAEIEVRRRELATFARIRTREIFSIPARQEKCKGEVEAEMRREKALQKRYSQLLTRYKALAKNRSRALNPSDE